MPIEVTTPSDLIPLLTRLDDVRADVASLLTRVERLEHPPPVTLPIGV